MVSKTVEDFMTMYGILDEDAEALQAKAVEIAGDYTAFSTSNRRIEMKFMSIPFVEDMPGDWKLVAVTDDGQAAFLRATMTEDEALQNSVGAAYNAILSERPETPEGTENPAGDEGMALVTALSDTETEGE